MVRWGMSTALALVLVLGLSVSCRARPQEEESVIQTVGSRPLTAIQAYPIAKARAQKWRGNAYLGEVSMIIPGNEVENGPRKIIYYFVADQGFGPLRWWDSVFITVDADTGKVIGFDESRWATSTQGKFSRFDIESAVLDSSDALRMAEGLGGKTYREKYPNAQVRICGSHGLIPGELFWDVGYFRPPEVRDDELSLGIEARTGEVRGDVYLPPFPAPK
jgi:hypothetical protein